MRGIRRPAVFWGRGTSVDVATLLSGEFAHLFEYRNDWPGAIDTAETRAYPALGESYAAEDVNNEIGFTFTEAFDPTKGLTVLFRINGAGVFTSAGSEWVTVTDGGNTEFRIQIDSSPTAVEFVNNSATSSTTISFPNGAETDITISAKGGTVKFYKDETLDSSPSHTMAADTFTDVLTNLSTSELDDLRAIVVARGEWTPSQMKAIAGL